MLGCQGERRAVLHAHYLPTSTCFAIPELLQICQTLVSTGTKAVFLHPVDALHGDIGIVSPGVLCGEKCCAAGSCFSACPHVLAARS